LDVAVGPRPGAAGRARRNGTQGPNGQKQRIGKTGAAPRTAKRGAVAR